MLSSGMSEANVTSFKYLDELFDSARTLSKFQNISKLDFALYIKRAPTDEIVSILSKIPKTNRLEPILGILTEKGIIKKSETLYYFGKLSKVDNAEDIVLNYLKKGEGSFSNRLDELLLVRRNAKYAGKVHPVSGVAFDLEGFPIFRYVYEGRLPKELYTKTDKEQGEYLLRQLAQAIRDDPKLRSKFTREQIEQIESGVKLRGYTWHHHQEPGRMQLVDSVEHTQTGHDGGRSIWGGGGEFR